MSDPVLRRQTRQRKVIVEELKKLTSHPTAAELYEATRRRLPHISLGTVYRNLALLGRMGVIRKVEGPGPEARYDGNVDPHHHVRCVRCGGVADVGHLPDSFQEDRPAEVGGFEILGVRFEFIGVCPDCREQQATGTGPSKNAEDQQGQ
jgi:Fur family ferric uptake transcriptional regulator